MALYSLLCCGQNFNLYWTSAKSRRHSKEISIHSQVAITVVRDTEQTGTTNYRRSDEVADKDLEHVDRSYSYKFGDKGRLTEVRNADENGRAYYEFKPNSIELWDEVNFPDSPKQNYKIDQ